MRAKTTAENENLQIGRSTNLQHIFAYPANQICFKRAIVRYLSNLRARSAYIYFRSVIGKAKTSASGLINHVTTNKAGLSTGLEFKKSEK